MPYDQVHSFSARLGGQTMTVVSKPGIRDWDRDWDRVSAASELLADTIELAASERVLLIGSGPGALGVALARRGGSVTLMDISAIALAMAGRTLQANGIANGQIVQSISVLPGQAESFDAAALDVPGDRRLARRWLVEAYGALKPGGRLYIAGANDHGARSVIADAEALFGGAQPLGYRGGSRVALTSKAAPGRPAPEWAGAPGIAPSSWYEFEAEARGERFHLRSLPGIFAYDRIDEGTRLLLDAIDVPAGAHVLDIGCGYGIIGLLAARLGAAGADLVDVNLFAVAAAAENITANGISGARALVSDGVPEQALARYDMVVTNPPFHTGKATNYDITPALIAGARRALKPGGALFLVANRFLAYEHELRPAFARVGCVAENRSYRVWHAAGNQMV
jgi:16S rRNA (guanine1207-N2)-methyltransferase